MNREQKSLEHLQISSRILSKRVDILSEKIREGTATTEEALKCEFLQQRLYGKKKGRDL